VGLKEYRRKRDFKKTDEPAGQKHQDSHERHFVIQKHAASRLHYDFRLEMEGVLRSWAVPKGPSLDPKDKRLAVHVEDHPLEYGSFEGIIPEGQYGGGTVLLWDRGEWIPDGDPVAAYHKGVIKFELDGKKLKGGWTLVRMPGEEGKNWLLIKERDSKAKPSDEYDITSKKTKSVASGRSIEKIAKDQDRVWQSNHEDKKKKKSTKPDSGKKTSAKSATKPQTRRTASVKKKPGTSRLKQSEAQKKQVSPKRHVRNSRHS
jgi:bifunctional non-homologous end joining protein LigD